MASTLSDRYSRTGAKLAQAGKFEEAIREYKVALEYSPGDLGLMNTIGDLCIRTGRNQEAIKYFVHIAKKYAAQNQASLATAILKKVTKLDPTNTEVLMTMGDLYRQQGRIADARQQFRSASTSFRRTGNLQDAVKALSRVNELEPSTSDRSELGETFLRTGLIDEANNAFMQAAQECLREDGLDEAIRLFERVLQFRRDSRPALKGLVEAYTRQGKQEKALRMIDSALAVSPEDVDLLVILGRTFLSAGMLGEAESAFNRLLALDESRYVYVLEVAQAYIEAGEYARAVRIVERCADLMIAKRHKKRATALLKEIVKRDNDNIGALKALASIYQRVGEKRNLSTTLNALVQVASKLGLREIAVDALRQLADLEPGKKAHRERLETIESSPDILGDGAPVGISTQEEIDNLTSDSSEYSTELLQDVLAKHPEFRMAQIKLLEDLVGSQPAYVEGRIKLKRHYLEAGLPSKAIEQCVAIAELYRTSGDSARANGFVDEANWLRTQFAGFDGVETGDAPVPSTDIALPVHTVREFHAEPLSDFDSVIVSIPLPKFLDREYGRAAREMTSLSIARVRVRTTDPDIAPRRIVAALESTLHRPADIVVQCGTEDYLAILPDTHAKGADVLEKRLRSSVEDLGNARVFVGIASAVPQTEGFATELLAEAEANLAHDLRDKAHTSDAASG
jgi:tetratricopeptide (TPR) repeat protein